MKLNLSHQTRIIEVGPKHPTYRLFLDLKENKAPNPNKLITLEGLWEVESAISRGVQLTQFFYCPELIRTSETVTLVEKAQTFPLSLLKVSEKNFKRLCDRDLPDGVAALAPVPLIPLNHLNGSLTLVLDGLEIPGNVGTILRSADGAGFDHVIFSSRKFRITHPKIIHASQGTVFNLPLSDAERGDVISFLEKKNMHIYLADSKTDKHYLETPIDFPACLVMGSEKQGIHTDWYNTQSKHLKIPMHGKSNSLNVACAATLLLYHLKSKTPKITQDKSVKPL